MIKNIIASKIGTLELVAISCFVPLSWVVFFRDQWAISIFAKNYPIISPFLSSTRTFLLNNFLNTLPTAIFLGLAILTFWLYIRAVQSKIPLKTAIIFSLVFQAVMVFSYPVLSVDVLSYINSDRLAVVHHQNVWTTPPDKFPEDKFYPLALDTKFVRIYGPTNQLIYTLPTMLSGDDLLINIFVHKLVVVAFVIATMGLVFKILKDFFPNQISQKIVLLFWNPLFIIETAGSGHNDILMLFFLLLSFYLFLKNKMLFSGIVIALAVQVKTTPLIFAPFIGIYFLRKFKVKDGLLFLLGFAVTYLTTFSFMGTTLSAIITRQGAANGAYWQSFPLLIDRHFSILSPLLKIALVLILFVQSIRTLLGRSPWLSALETLFLYLLFFLPTLWNWYPLWALAFIPFFPASKLSKMIIGFTLGTLLAYGVYWVALRLGHQNPIWQFIMYGTILISTLSALVYVPNFEAKK